MDASAYFSAINLPNYSGCMKTHSGYITNFTVFRGIGSFFVAYAHYQLFLAYRLNPGLHVSMHQFFLAVDSFFVMSGFIMLHVYQDKFRNGISRTAFKDFIVARFGRVYPLHLFTLLILVTIFYLNDGNFSILTNQGNEAANPHAILTNLLMLQSFPFHKIHTWNMPSWSLSAEWWPYFTLPFIAYWFHTRKKTLVALLVVIIPLTYASVMYVLPKVNIYNPSLPAPHDLDTTFQYGFLRGIAGFFSGILTYILFQEERIRKFFGKDIIYVLLLFTGITALYKDVNDIICIALISAFLLSAACNVQYVSKWSNFRPLQFLGDISYSVYMNHLLVILFFIKMLKSAGILDSGTKCPVYLQVTILVSFLATVLAMSTLTYYMIEVKCRKWINEKWSNRKYSNQDTKQGRLTLQR